MRQHSRASKPQRDFFGDFALARRVKAIDRRLEYLHGLPGPLVCFEQAAEIAGGHLGTSLRTGPRAGRFGLGLVSSSMLFRATRMFATDWAIRSRP
jgi:hypothetical protein